MTRIWQFSAALIFCLFGSIVSAQDATWKVGLASVKITPQQPHKDRGTAAAPRWRGPPSL